MKKQIISSRQFTIITLLFTVGTAILIIPSSVTNVAKQDAWIATSVGVGLSFLLVKLYVTLGNLNPTLTFTEANEKILGRFFGKLTAIGFTILTFFGAGQLLYFIGNFMSTEVMPETPPMAFSLLFGIIIIFAAFQGIEVFARSTEILFPIFMLIFIIFVSFISPLIHFENLQPILETSKKSLFIGVIRFMSICSFPLAALLILYPSAVNVHKSAHKGFYIGTAIGGIVLIIIVSLCLLVIGPSNTANRTFPSYALAQRISIGHFLQRVEIIMAAMWIISIYVKTFMYFYASVIGIAQICKIKDHRPLIVPLGMISIGFSQIIHPDIVHSNTYNNEIWPLFCGTFAILLPIVLLIAAKIRNINGNQGNENVTNCNCCPQNASGSNNGNTSNNASNNNSQNAVQNGSNCNCGNASNNASNSNSQNASTNENNSNSQNASNNESNSNSQNASTNANINNSQNASTNANNSNSQNTSNNASNSNSQNTSNNASNSNSQNASNNASNSNSQNTSTNANINNSQNAVQNGSNCNCGNASNNASNSNSQNTSTNASNSNSQNTSTNASNSNSQDTSNNASNSNSQNASTNASNSNSQNASTNANNNNSQNASNNESNSNSQNAVQNGSNCNCGNVSNNASNSSIQNASTNASNSNSQNTSTNASNSNSQNASTNASNSNSQNTAKNKSNTNSLNDSINENPSEN
ncbi:GerAB/ArcD/ProY family transporter [Lysinibacillus sphaericus]|uniref:GerAB/ArcD/ProY family transporter n=1 Tax=Lysinibacillus sphaericus TaxID=1421 RepID=UPI001CBC706D|nr:endospore germination permease [Lysinibacillus sphaericus]